MLPVFDGEAFLGDSIGSILSQTHQRLELLAVDDGSTDRSGEVVRQFASQDSRVRLITVPRGGAQRARNHGVAAARGSYIAHLDQDNVSATNRLELQLARMQQQQLDVCGSWARVFGEGDYLRWVPEHHEDILNEFLFTTAMIHSTTMMTAGIAQSNPFDENATYGGYELLTRLGLRYRLGNVPAVLLEYRLHARQRTRMHGEAVHADRLRFRERLFFARFPLASADDYRAIAGVADDQPFESDADRQRAESWLARFAETASPMSAHKMRQRAVALQARPV